MLLQRGESNTQQEEEICKGEKNSFGEGLPPHLEVCSRDLRLSLFSSISLLTLLSSLSAPSIEKGMGAGRGIGAQDGLQSWPAAGGPEVVCCLDLGLWVNVAVCGGAASITV